jgi:hypothetical protein
MGELHYIISFSTLLDYDYASADNRCSCSVSFNTNICDTPIPPGHILDQELTDRLFADEDCAEGKKNARARLVINAQMIGKLTVNSRRNVLRPLNASLYAAVVTIITPAQHRAIDRRRQPRQLSDTRAVAIAVSHFRRSVEITVGLCGCYSHAG